MLLPKKIRALIVIVAIFSYTCNIPCAQAQENAVLHAANGKVVDAGGNPVALQCVNLSDWLVPEPYLLVKAPRALLISPSEFKENLADFVGPGEAQSFWQEWENSFVTENDFRLLSQQGFNCVRLPLNYKYIVNDPQNDFVTLNDAALEPVDQAVVWGARYGIHVFLDLHNAPGGQNSISTVSDVPSYDKTARLWEGPAAHENQQLTVALWHALAIRYAKAGSVGGYDILNEPVLPPDVPQDTLANLYSSIIASIRSVDQSHMIIIEGNNYAHDFSSLLPPPDNNIMYEFHEYGTANPAWKMPNQEALEPYLQLRASSHMPLWLGEFGENTSDWQLQMVRLMNANQIGWSVWPWKRIGLGNGHPVIETIVMPRLWNKLSRYIVGAILAGKPTQGQARRAMSQMLQAIRSENCKEDQAVRKILTGQ